MQVGGCDAASRTREPGAGSTYVLANHACMHMLNEARSVHILGCIGGGDALPARSCGCRPVAHAGTESVAAFQVETRHPRALAQRAQ